jgi:hypothetical protein
MINKIMPFAACFLLLYGSNALSSNCFRIYGRIHTNTLDTTSGATLGTLSFKTRWGGSSCAIQGKFVGTNKLGFPELTHQISCNDGSIINSTDSISEFSPIDDCRVYIEQDAIMTPVSGHYKGYTGETFLRGTINQCSGKNNLRYRGYLCLDEERNDDYDKK